MKFSARAGAAIASVMSYRAFLKRFDSELHRLEENLGAIAVDLTADDLQQIDSAASKLHLEGARLPEYALNMTGL